MLSRLTKCLDTEWNLDELVQEYKPFLPYMPLRSLIHKQNTVKIYQFFFFSMDFFFFNWKLLKKIATIEVSGGELPLINFYL